MIFSLAIYFLISILPSLIQNWIDSHLSHRSLPAMSDPVLAKMRVRNLLHNALQHAGTGRVAIDLNRHGLTVKDSGPGLPDAYKSRLCSTAPAAAPEGAIGLYLVTLIAENLGWHPEVTDTPDGGASISLTWEHATIRPPRAPPQPRAA